MLIITMYRNNMQHTLYKKRKTRKSKGVNRNERPQPTVIRLCITIMWRKEASLPVDFPARLARQLWRRTRNIVKRRRGEQGRSSGCTVWISSERRLAVRSNARQSRSRSPVMSRDCIREGHASFSDSDARWLSMSEGGRRVEFTRRVDCSLRAVKRRCACRSFDWGFTFTCGN